MRGFIQCRFGGTSSNGIVIGPSTIQCSAPGLAPQPRGWVDVELVTSHQGAAAVGVHYQGQHLAGKFYYHSVNVVSRIEPPTGPTNGGTAIALYGRFDHFASLRCRFGSQSEALTVPRFVDASRIECTSAPQAVPAAHIVQVTSNGQQYCESSVHFTYHFPLDVISLLPARVKSEGGTIVELRASHALPLYRRSQGYVFCHFGTVTSPASSTAADTVQCAAPALAPGYVTVELTANGQDYTTTGVQVHYVQVNIFAIQPASGPRLGGTRVILSGANLLSTFTCLFGGQPAVATETHGRGRLACTTGSFAVTGWTPLELFEGNRSLSSTSMFHVDEAAEVSLTVPQLGPVDGGETRLSFARNPQK